MDLRKIFNGMDVDSHLKIIDNIFNFGVYSSSENDRERRADHHPMSDRPSESKLLQERSENGEAMHHLMANQQLEATFSLNTTIFMSILLT